MTERQTSRDENHKLKGTELTHEQFSDVYMAGTSDGIHQLKDRKVKVEQEGYEPEEK
ncbi:YozQ family protein [Paenibacillus tarimensis]|uniref:YozQ family protein n=1 Tax=Paenibacillus tarimensis TaxID=416012 RepID=UPI001F2F5021|nr:YozQ family protein [Paenibacillus tarimensis]MCF2946446.1 YozQ family protein [Paenibacillus tarimensis]